MVGFNGTSTDNLPEEVQQFAEALIGRLEAFRGNIVNQLRALNEGLPIYANNAAAITGGLTAGEFYRTGADPDLVCVVR